MTELIHGGARRRMVATAFERLVRLRIPALVFGVSFVFYLATLAPGVLWGDDAKFQLQGYLLSLTADELGHPLYVAIAHLFSLLPTGQLAWRINLVSAVSGSLALVWVYLAAQVLTHNVSAAIASAAAFAVSHTFWSFAVRPQAHALDAFFAAVLLWAALRWSGRLAGLFTWSFVFGVGLINHFLLAFAVPALAWLFYLRARALRRSLLPMGIGLFFALLGFAPFLLLSAEEGTTSRTYALVGIAQNLFVVQTPLRDLALWAGFLAYNFVGIALPLVLLGAWQMWHRQRGVLLGIALLYLGDVWFVFDSKLPDQYKYYIPSYLALSLLVAPGFCVVQNWLSVRLVRARYASAVLWFALVAVPLLSYAAAPAVLHYEGITTLLDVRNLPGRDVLAFFLEPSKNGYNGADDFARAALADAAPDAVLAGDHTLLAPIRFIMTSEERRPDIMLVDLPATGQAAVLQQWAASRPLYLLDTQKYVELDTIEQIFDIQPTGVLFRLVPHEKR